MPLIDERGRLFGRLNIIDAALVALVLVFLPVAYTAVKLFRPPTPQIDSVQPTEQAGGPGRRIMLHGRNFRPYLRAFVSPTGQPYTLIDRSQAILEGIVRLETPDLLEVELPHVADGSYDLYLYDETQEVARRIGAFALTPAAALLHANIRFTAPPEIATLVKAGDVAVILDRAETPTPAVLKRVRIVSDRAFEVRQRGEPGWKALRWDDELIDADVEIPVRQAAYGVWRYGTQTVRAGESFFFQTTWYSMTGTIASTLVSPATAANSTQQGPK